MEHSYDPHDNPSLTLRQLEVLRREDAERARWAKEHPDATTGEKRARTNRYYKALRAEGIDPKTRTSSPGARQAAGVWDEGEEQTREQPARKPWEEAAAAKVKPWEKTGEREAEVREQHEEAREQEAEAREQQANGGVTFANKYVALAAAQALYKALGAVVGTKDPDNLRGQCDAELRAAYESEDPATKKDRQPITIGGVRVGTLSVVESKPADHKEMVVADQAAFETWAVGAGLASASMTVRFNPSIRNPIAVEAKLREVFGAEAVSLSVEADPVAVASHMKETGELPDGAHMVEVHEPARFKGTRITVDEKKVFEQLARASLPQAGGIVAALEEVTGKE